MSRWFHFNRNKEPVESRRSINETSSYIQSEMQTVGERTEGSGYLNQYAEESHTDLSGSTRSLMRQMVKKQRKCKFHKLSGGFLASMGFILSFLSILDCRFVRVDIGFVPENLSMIDSDRSYLGIGLWSVEDPDNTLFCIRGVGSLTEGDELYDNILLNGDPYWEAARFMALVGTLFGFFDLIFTWITICTPASSYSVKRILSILYLSLSACCCEGIKFGLFFTSAPCGQELWQDTINNQTSFYEADQCMMDRATYLSLSAILCYFILILLAAGNLIFPDYHRHHLTGSDTQMRNVTDLDDVSMPSFLQSIGESVSSRFSKNSKNSRGSSISSRAEQSAASYSSREQGMAPILEEERD